MSSVTDPTPLHNLDAGHGAAPAGAADHHHGLGHVSPWQTLVKVWLALMVLTVLTVMATWVNLGPGNIWIAMGVAFLKAALVVLFFMHLKYEKPFLAYVFTFTLAFVAFFLAMVMLDSKAYAPSIEERRLDLYESKVIAVIDTAPVSTAPVAKTPAPNKH